MVEFETKVLDTIQRTRNVKSIRFEIKLEASFNAGQFFLVAIEVEGKEESKYFSISNSPTEKGYLEFTKRITQSPFSKGLDKIKRGDWARLRMPYGVFTPKKEHAKIAFLSGGIGITPIRSICKFSTDKELDTDIALLYGNNKEEDIVFRDDFDAMQKANKNIRVVYTLTSPDIDRSSWTGKTGYIDDKMIKDQIPDLKERFFYLCGPPAMVKNLADILSSGLSVENNRIITEDFAGY